MPSLREWRGGDTRCRHCQGFGTSDLFNEYHETALLLVVSGLVMIGKQTGIRLQAYVAVLFQDSNEEGRTNCAAAAQLE